jgi:hypothetical protein
LFDISRALKFPNRSVRVNSECEAKCSREGAADLAFFVLNMNPGIETVILQPKRAHMENVRQEIKRTTQRLIEWIKEGNEVILRLNVGLKTWQFVFWG